MLIDAASILGVSQRAIENDYYMVDIPRLISAKQRAKQEHYLMTLNTLIASNNRSMEQADYKRHVQQLTPRQTAQAAEKFDRNKFEELRQMTLRGANKA